MIASRTSALRGVPAGPALVLALTLGVLVTSGPSALAAGADQQGDGQAKAAAQGYDAAMQAKKDVPITFGHDVDLKGKAWDFALTLIDKAELSAESLNTVKGALLNANDFWEDTRANGLNGEDLNRFVVKTLLDNLDKREVVKIKKTFHLSREATKAIAKDGIGVVEAASEAAGDVAGGDAPAALETALLTALDLYCSPCAVAREGAMVAVEAAREVEAWMQDEATKIQYEAWKRDEGNFLTIAGFGPTMVAARRALEAIYESQGRKTPATEQELEQFIRQRFQTWKHAEDAAQADIEVLEAARQDYLELTDAEREGFGGGTEQERADAFASVFLPIYKTLVSQKGDRPFPPGGQKALLDEAVRLAHIRASDGEGAYRDRMFDALRNYGWIAAISPERRNAVKERLADRMSHLSFANLKTFLDYAEVNQTTTFYGCLCGRLPGVGIGKKFEPNGPPCHMTGLGEWWDPFPADPKAWQICLAETPVGGQSFADHLTDRIIKWTAVK